VHRDISVTVRKIESKLDLTHDSLGILISKKRSNTNISDLEMVIGGNRDGQGFNVDSTLSVSIVHQMLAFEFRLT